MQHKTNASPQDNDKTKTKVGRKWRICNWEIGEKAAEIIGLVWYRNFSKQNFYFSLEAAYFRLLNVKRCLIDE